MGRSIFYRLFRVGRLPGSVRDVLAAEGGFTVEEELSGSVTYRDFRGHGKYFSRRREWFTGAIAVTRRRCVALAFRRKVIDIAFDDPRWTKFALRVDGDEMLVIECDAAVMQQGFTGHVEYRFKVDRAGALLRMLQERTRVRDTS